jgi:hypothetical protein
VGAPEFLTFGFLEVTSRRFLDHPACSNGHSRRIEGDRLCSKFPLSPSHMTLQCVNRSSVICRDAIAASAC